MNHGVVLGSAGPFRGSKSGAFANEAFASLPADPLMGASAFTVEGWIHWAGGSSYGQPVFAFGSGSSDYMYLTPASSASKHLMLAEIDTSAGTATVKAKKELPAETWEYVAVTETSEGTLTLYLNGEVDGTPLEHTAVSPASLGSNVPDVYLGKSLTGGPYFAGSMSNMAFYDKALTAEQIKQHYVVAESPVNVEPPEIKGSPKEGVALTAGEGSWSGLEPISLALQWQRCQGSTCTSIAKATKASYTPVSEDVDSTLQLAVTATNSADKEGVLADSPRTATVEGKPANTALPSITGEAADGQEAKVGEQLTVSEGSWRAFPPATFTYLWESCVKKTCKEAEGKAKQAAYRIVPSQLGDTLRAVVTASNTLGEASATSAATAKVVAGPPVNVTPPTIKGRAEEGQTLEAEPGTWAGSEHIEITNYAWLHCKGGKCEAIPGASGAKDTAYRLSAGDVGYGIEVEVTAKNSVSTATAASLPTSEVTEIPPENTELPRISGEARDGQTLTASTGKWTGTPPLEYAFQWEECNSSGRECHGTAATGTSLTLEHGDVGKTIRVSVTAKNQAGHPEATSEPTPVVAPQPPSNKHAPTISGEAKDGQTLSASPGEWEGTPPFEYAFQWEECNSSGRECHGTGATSTSFTLEHGDVGKTIRVTVTAKNQGGHAAASSEPTPAVRALAPSNTAPPIITGEAKVGQTVSASTGSWSGTPLLEYTYQWEACDSLGGSCLPISGATAASYQPTSGYVGDTLVVTVTATNAAGSAQASSEATAPVTAECSDTWTGAAGDSLWRTAGNWSTGSVPAGGDRVCLPSGATVRITGGSEQAGSIAGEGSLAISGGSLELAGSSEVSNSRPPPPPISSAKDATPSPTGSPTKSRRSSNH